MTGDRPAHTRPRPLVKVEVDCAQSIVRHLERALEATDAAEKDRHIREALQQPAKNRGELFYA